MVMTPHPAFETRTDPRSTRSTIWRATPISPHPLPHLSPGRVPRDYIITQPHTPRSPTAQRSQELGGLTAIHEQVSAHGNKAAARVTGGLSACPRPGRGVDQLGDVSLGGGLLGVFQGQDQLPAGFEPAIVDLTDGVSVL
jgi:hypothetical protein